MENKKFTLPDMITSRYAKDRNTIIRWKNKSQGKDNIPEVDIEDMLAKIDTASENDITLLRSALQQCWKTFFEEAEDRVYPVLDDLLNVKLD